MASNQELIWAKQIEFILCLLSFAIGLGNVWRFPFLCYKNGGGAFLLPYFISLFLIGLPVFFLEISLGQFSGLHSIDCWNIAPAFRGIGYSTLFIAFFLGCYYNIIVSICIQYLYFSWHKVLPWTMCNASWNKNCTPGDEATQFFNNKVLGITSEFGQTGHIMKNMAGTYFVAWVLVFFCLSFSIKSLGKVSYVTSIFPYIMMTILVVRTVLLPGSKEGISFYLKPNVQKLKNANVWKDAASQIFFSLSACVGGIITLSSHNKFHNNIVRDSILVSFLNCATSFYVGFAIFATIGYLAHISNKLVPEVVKSGFGLAFIAYPTGLSKLPIPQFWSTLFFIMMLLLGLGSMLSITEGALAPLETMLPPHSRKVNILFRGLICAISFVIGIAMCFQDGQHLLEIVDHGITIDYVWVGIFECFSVMYVYGFKNYAKDMKYMLGKKLNYYWLFTIAGTAPVILTVILISTFVDFKYAATNYKGKVINVLIVSVPIVFISIYMAGYCLLRYFKKIKESPVWQPPSAYQDEYNEKFKTDKKQKTNL